MFVYQWFREAGVFTVGFYDPTGDFVPESDHRSAESAAKHTAWLNGSGSGECQCNECDKLVAKAD